MAESSFDEFLTHALPQLLCFAHRLSADAQTGEDLVRAGLVKTKGRWASIERQEDPLTYARQVIITTHTSRWRRWFSRVSVGTNPAHVSAERSGLSAQQRQVRDALLELSPRQRAVLVLRVAENLSDAQIATALRCRQGAVRSAAAHDTDALGSDEELRRALTDDGWSLPVWQAPKQLLRRASRRRALVATSLIAAVLALAAGIAIPLAAAQGSASHSRHQVAIDSPGLNQTRPPLPGIDDPRFPAAVYPLPVGPVQGGFPQCPSIDGVGPRPTLDPAAYAGVLSDFGHPSMLNDLRRTDRSLWPLVLAADENPPVPAIPQELSSGHDPGKGLIVVPATKDGLARGAAAACGAGLVDQSVAVQVGPIAFTSATADDVLILERHGHLLIWGRDPALYANGSLLAYRSDQRLIEARSIVAPCLLNGSSTADVTLVGPDAARVTIANAGGSPAPCSLIGWPTMRLATPDYTQQVSPTDVGLDTPVLLRPGQAASFTLTAKRCGGARQTYSNGQFDDGDLALVLSVGPCGATVTSYHLDR